MDAFTSYLEPRMREMVLALAGDSTTTRLLLFLGVTAMFLLQRALRRLLSIGRGHRPLGPSA